MSTALSTRPQQGHNRVAEMSTRYARDGRLIVKSHSGKWMTFPAFVAHQFAERLGVTLPAGCRVITLDKECIEPRTLAVKERGRDAVPLTRWVREAKQA